MQKQKYLVLVGFDCRSRAMTVTSNVKVDSENNIYFDLSYDLEKALVFVDNGQTIKNVKSSLNYNEEYKVIQVLLN